ncbi:MAG: hypothetical protein LUG61_05865 [Lachnospiraceae bacterium]|nr:hypothetical protein [Lachnospiraceae bacterium]
MKNNVRKNRRLMTVAAGLMAVVLLCVGSLTVSASTAASGSVDLTKTGSLTVTLQETGGAATVSDGALTIYQVADVSIVDHNLSYTYTSAFSACTVSLADLSDDSLADDLYAWMSGRNIIGTSQTLSSDGTVTFSGLSLGLYLVVQTTGSTGYYAVDPFVVSIPMTIDSQWVYEVNASPKVETKPVTPEEPEEPGEPETPQEPETPEETQAPETGTVVLPQTGQLNWPIPLLTVGGCILFVIGWVLTLTDRKRKKYAQ